MLFKATLKAKKILEENKIKVVFSVGGSHLLQLHLLVKFKYSFSNP